MKCRPEVMSTVRREAGTRREGAGAGRERRADKSRAADLGEGTKKGIYRIRDVAGCY